MTVCGCEANVVMRPCKALLQSSASLRPLYTSSSYILATRRIQSRPYSSGGQPPPEDDAQNAPGRRPRASPTAPPTEEEPSSNGKPFRIDSANRTIETAAGDLPLSPVMDPSFWDARKRHRTLKARPKKAQNSVERQFRANPFAKALATPVRQCTTTKTRLPNFFLQDFNLVQHPETGQPWWVPHGLLQKQQHYGRSRSLVGEEEEGDGKGGDISEAMREAAAEAEREAVESEQLDQEDVTEAAEAEAEAGEEGTATPTKNEASQIAWQRPPLPITSTETDHDTADAATKPDGSGGKPYGPKAHILARRDLLAAFTTPRSGFQKSERSLFGGSSSRYRALSGKTVWREDMDAYVLGLMRNQAADHLLYLAGLSRDQGRYYVVRCFGWADVEFKHKGAVLWFGEPGVGVGGDGGGGGEREEAGSGRGPGAFATLDTQTRNLQGELNPTTVPVHNMPALLGDALVSHIREAAGGIFDDDKEHGAIFMLAGRRTTDLQASLWKLQGYLADYRTLP